MVPPMMGVPLPCPGPGPGSPPMTGPFPDGAPGAFGVLGWVGIVGGGV
ncbi:hypothetical protein [Gordonia liuliyuniae]|uniref:Uncharacterized protein n=1 Tax=Gordonia liuliyuniae TaxID=2911517 RepID=A0ABS9INM3_9ACTN|nr:hypothetical protein [Gordonia liuliyuniae]MCF8587154.1 hypothetical protein [Gordonia liuliyuniae]